MHICKFFVQLAVPLKPIPANLDRLYLTSQVLKDAMLGISIVSKMKTPWPGQNAIGLIIVELVLCVFMFCL